MSVKRHECEEKWECDSEEAVVYRARDAWFIELGDGELIAVRYCPFCGVKLE